MGLRSSTASRDPCKCFHPNQDGAWLTPCMLPVNHTYPMGLRSAAASRDPEVGDSQAQKPDFTSLRQYFLFPPPLTKTSFWRGGGNKKPD
ncbi:MAG: hypothetical protein R6V32_06670 [Bacteroidales bacterium]